MNYGFRTLHPLVLVTYYITAVIAITINRHPLFLFFTILLLIIFNWSIDKGKTLKSWFRFLLLFALLLFLINPLVNHRGQHILFYLFNNPVTLEAVVQGLINGFTFLAVMLLFITFPLIVHSEKFLFLFSKVFPKWGLVAMLAVRFVPLFRIRLQEMVAVQRTQGINIARGAMRQRLKNGIKLVQMLLTWSLEDGIETADSMAARGYGIQKRSQYNPYQMHAEDIFSLLFMAGLSVITISGAWLGDGVFVRSPVVELVFLYGWEWLFFAIHCLLVGFPLIVTAKEEAQWLYWKQKM